MLKRVLLSASAAIVTSATAAQPVPAPPAASEEASVAVPREVLERYAGCYELNGTVATVGVTEDGRLAARLTGQAPGPPLRTVGANEFAADAVGVRLFFEGDGPQATRIRSRYNGSEMIGRRIAAASTAPATCPEAAPFDAAARQDVVTNLGATLRQRYVFPDVAEQAASRIEAALAAGAYDGLADPAAFAARLDADVAAVAHDKHLRVSMANAPPAPPPGALTARPPRGEAGVVRADKLAGGVGYIEVIGFPPPEAFKPVIDRAMSALAGSEALIIDLRRNGGGSFAVFYLESFLVAPDKPVHLSDVVTRTPGTNDFTRESFHSEPTPVTFAGIPVYVLTSGATFSAAENFAYVVQSHKLGIIVGETTGGGAHPTGFHTLGSGLGAGIPFARSDDPITHGNWEGRGVEPDVAVPAADALRVALERLGREGVADIAAASREQVFAPRAVALPGMETALRSMVAGAASGAPDYAAMSPAFAELARRQLPQWQSMVRPLGEIQSVEFLGPVVPAGDLFEVTFANGKLQVGVALGPDGKIVDSRMRPAPPGG